MPVNSFDGYPLSWKPDLSKTMGPKYTALAELLEEDIKNGKLTAGACRFFGSEFEHRIEGI